MNNSYFTSNGFRFLRSLAANNQTEWFDSHRSEYEQHVRLPLLRLAADAGAPLGDISPHLAGGAVFRIRRDVRFSDDKTPYKGHTGVYFRHAAMAGSASPGFYLRLEPGNCFLSAGAWRPAGPAAAAIRTAIAAQPDVWLAATRRPEFEGAWRMDGERLVRPPRGFDPGGDLIDEIRRRDFVARRRFTQGEVAAPDFLDLFVDSCRQTTPLMRFVCTALDLSY